MANTIVRYSGPSGLSLTLELFPEGSDVLAGSYSLTEETNAKSWYLATVSDALAGQYRVVVKIGSNVLSGGWVSLEDDTETYEVKDEPEVASTAPSAAVIADAVWDEAYAGHTTAGTYGALMTSFASSLSTLLSRISSGVASMLASLVTMISGGAFTRAALANAPTIIVRGDGSVGDSSGDIISGLLVAHVNRDSSVRITVSNNDGNLLTVADPDFIRVKIGREGETPMLDLKSGTDSSGGSGFTLANPFDLFISRTDAATIGRGIWELEVLVFDSSADKAYHAQKFLLEIRETQRGSIEA